MVIHPDTNVLILSVGVKNRHQEPQKTSIKRLRAVYRKDKSACPNSDIRFPLINYSQNLAKNQCILATINDHIKSHLLNLQPLPQQQFVTTEDDIHWTADTANWCKYLHSLLIFCSTGWEKTGTGKANSS